MAHYKITIESARPDRPTEKRYELAMRVYAEGSDDERATLSNGKPKNVEQIAATMLTAWCAANPGMLATYCITGLSAHDMGERW